MSVVAVAALAQDVDLVLEAVDLPAEARLDTRLRREQVWTGQTHRGKEEVNQKDGRDTKRVNFYMSSVEIRCQYRRGIWEGVRVCMQLSRGPNVETV